MRIVVMGVAGSGKSTIGALLAKELDCRFSDADALHTEASIAQMRRGIALTDDDRGPWLAAVRARLVEASQRGETIVVACSALKQAYRAFLGDGMRITWILLTGPEALIRERLQRRADHFMPAELLASQIDALEAPADAIHADVRKPPHAIVEQILATLPPAPQVHVLEDSTAMSRAAAGAVVRTTNDVVRVTGRCSLVLSGGSTPRALYALLASEFREQVPWRSVHVFWSDERYVPPEDPRSNYRMARESLLDHVPCPAENVHPMPTHLADPNAAAEKYEETLRRYFPGEWPRFDLALLGMGEDGHTASLFPQAPALHERTRWAVAATGPAGPPVRLTLTLPALNRSAHVHFLVAGAAKQHAVARVLAGSADTEAYPAAAIRSRPGRLVWWLDRDAAAGHHACKPSPRSV